MKYARLVSINSALRRLLEGGQFHEQGILQRPADETSEDILFLALGRQNGLKSLHKKYLKLFWREEFEQGTDPGTYQPRYMVSRKEVREYIGTQTRLGSAPVDRMVHGVYSGFVHGASTPIFDLIDLQSGKYRILGIGDDVDRQGYLRDALNYPVRLLMSGVVLARAYGDREQETVLMPAVDEYLAWLDQEAGRGS